MHWHDFEHQGFEWIDCHDSAHSVLSLVRHGQGQSLICLFNFTPVPRENYIVGVPRGGRWLELLNSDAECYGGAGFGNAGGVDSAPLAAQGKSHSLYLTLPPLGVLYLKPAA